MLIDIALSISPSIGLDFIKVWKLSEVSINLTKRGPIISVTMADRSEPRNSHSCIDFDNFRLLIGFIYNFVVVLLLRDKTLSLKSANAELSGNFTVIMGRLRPDYHGEIVCSSDWLARSEAER